MLGVDVPLILSERGHNQTVCCMTGTPSNYVTKKTKFQNSRKGPLHSNDRAALKTVAFYISIKCSLSGCLWRTVECATLLLSSLQGPWAPQAIGVN